MTVYPSLFRVFSESSSINNKTPLLLRILGAVVLLIHVTLTAVYLFALLYSSDIKTLYYILFGCFIIYETTLYFKGCILTEYEEINSDIFPPLSNIVCSMFNSSKECEKNTNTELFIVSLGIVLPLLKIFGLYVHNSMTGKNYVCQVK
jgi:hypothetical protein